MARLLALGRPRSPERLPRPGQVSLAQTIQPVSASPSTPDSSANVRTMARPCARPSGPGRSFHAPPSSRTSSRT